MAAKAVGKRFKISKLQQQMMMAVLGASLVLGVSIVVSVHLLKHMSFNAKVISKRDESIANYNLAIKNVGICKPSSKDGRFSDKDLEKCNPQSIDVSTIPGTLRYNVMVNMANNTDLESVGRSSQKQCYDDNHKRVDFTAAYSKSTSDDERSYNLKMMKMCSALRVIPDALPAQKNDEALLASLNQIFLLSGFEPEQLSPGTNYKQSKIKGVSTIPIALTVKRNEAETMSIISNIERSIRAFSINSAQIKWGSNASDGSSKLELLAQGVAYYSAETSVQEKTEVVTAKEEKKKTGGSGGTNKNGASKTNTTNNTKTTNNTNNTNNSTKK